MTNQPPPSEGLDVEQLRKEFRYLLENDWELTIERMRDQPGGKIILNSDDLFMVLPRYANISGDRIALGPILYPVAREFTDKIYQHLLSKVFERDDTVIFTAGGSATGKSSILRAAGKQPGADFVVDTTLSHTGRADGQIETALASGRKVEIHYVFRDFKQSVLAMLKRANDPRSGRVVPIDDMAMTHFGSQRTILFLLTKYQDDDRVAIRLKFNDGKSGKLREMTLDMFVKELHPSVDFLKKKGQTTLNDCLKNSKNQGWQGEDHHGRRSGLRISQALYEAARSKTESGRSSSLTRDARKISKSRRNCS